MLILDFNWILASKSQVSAMNKLRKMDREIFTAYFNMLALLLLSLQ